MTHRTDARKCMPRHLASDQVKRCSPRTDRVRESGVSELMTNPVVPTFSMLKTRLPCHSFPYINAQHGYLRPHNATQHKAPDGFHHEAVTHLGPPPPLRARDLRRYWSRRRDRLLPRAVQTGRVHHLRQLPRAEARWVRLRLRPVGRQGLHAPPR